MRIVTVAVALLLVGSCSTATSSAPAAGGSTTTPTTTLDQVWQQWAANATPELTGISATLAKITDLTLQLGSVPIGDIHVTGPFPACRALSDQAAAFDTSTADTYVSNLLVSAMAFYDGGAKSCETGTDLTFGDVDMREATKILNQAVDQANTMCQCNLPSVVQP